MVSNGQRNGCQQQSYQCKGEGNCIVVVGGYGDDDGVWCNELLAGQVGKGEGRRDMVYLTSSLFTGNRVPEVRFKVVENVVEKGSSEVAF